MRMSPRSTSIQTSIKRKTRALMHLQDRLTLFAKLGVGWGMNPIVLFIICVAIVLERRT
jgi:hypothetical protein